ncbi:MAG: hypothetical protein ACLTDP_06985 [Terrisporobacter sp.]
MNSLSEKIYLELDMPSDEDTLGDKDRIIKALEEKYTNVVMPYDVVKTLYPMCRNSSFKITVTMIKKEYNWLITKALIYIILNIYDNI